jgi:GNAT superfamily N-acetyltransferase
MPLTITTDHAEIGAVLDGYLAADPVGATMLGTIRTTLEDTAWMAVSGDSVAVRSAAEYPVAVTGPWPDPAELGAALGGLPDVRGLYGASDVVEPLISDAAAGREVTRMEQCLFRLEELHPPVGVAGRPGLAGEAERELVHEWVKAFMIEAHDVAARSPATVRRVADRLVDEDGGWLWFATDGTPVSLAGRRPVLAGSARVGPVYTPPEQRGRGYGSAVTAAATQAILDDGGVPVLFTDLANPTSNKIYQLLGYRPVERRVVVTFR